MERNDRRATPCHSYHYRGAVIDYLIFGRREYQQPLEWIGALTLDREAPEAELDRRARERFGNDWLEMVAVPRPATLQVIPLE